MSEIIEMKVYQHIKETLEVARSKACIAINYAMVEAYWNIGKIIVEAQEGNERAAYGKELLKSLSRHLTKEYGKGFTVTNLSYMRQFYLGFQNYHALRDNLSWTHYRILLKVQHQDARDFYLEECIKCNWSTRELERQINTFIMKDYSLVKIRI